MSLSITHIRTMTFPAIHSPPRNGMRLTQRAWRIKRVCTILNSRKLFSFSANSSSLFRCFNVSVENWMVIVYPPQECSCESWCFVVHHMVHCHYQRNTVNVDMSTWKSVQFNFGKTIGVCGFMILIGVFMCSIGLRKADPVTDPFLRYLLHP